MLHDLYPQTRHIQQTNQGRTVNKITPKQICKAGGQKMGDKKWLGILSYCKYQAHFFEQISAQIPRNTGRPNGPEGPAIEKIQSRLKTWNFQSPRLVFSILSWFQTPQNTPDRKFQSWIEIFNPGWNFQSWLENFTPGLKISIQDPLDI